MTVLVYLKYTNWLPELLIEWRHFGALRPCLGTILGLSRSYSGTAFLCNLGKSLNLCALVSYPPIKIKIVDKHTFLFHKGVVGINRLKTLRHYGNESQIDIEKCHYAKRKNSLFLHFTVSINPPNEDNGKGGTHM